MAPASPPSSPSASIAARAAACGARIVRDAGLHGSATVEAKGLPGDYVTDVDLASEAAIVAFLASETPDIPVHGEEGGGQTGDRYWVVDPLDGTTNFAHGFPAVGVSVALIEQGHPTAGSVCAPFLGTVYSGARGEGAWISRHGDEPVRLGVSQREPARAVVATGFPFRRKARLLEGYLMTMTAALARFEDLRRPGAASLDLAWVAEGVFDGFFELSLGPWDVAAGGILIEEAGGVVTDWEGGPDWLAGDILAGPPAVHAELLGLAAMTRPR
jgi:myo-inositol-1(or 4)-monophosphatase